ncbi:MAG: hypothetical protein WC518_04365 [Patescibacteria group bacterium]
MGFSNLVPGTPHHGAGEQQCSPASTYTLLSMRADATKGTAWSGGVRCCNELHGVGVRKNSRQLINACYNENNKY